MTDPSLYEYPSPLAGYEDLPPLPCEKADGGKGKEYVNPQTGVLSKAYEEFVDPITHGERGAFDVHVYFLQVGVLNEEYTKFAYALWERIRREFPELRVYRVWEMPVGPHPIGMFEVNIFTPAQFGAFVPWLVINRGPLSALIHPNTDDEARDHTQRATWMGERLPLDLSRFRKMGDATAMKEAREKLEKVIVERNEEDGHP
ncbi:hypothetical protein MMC24_007458 [Lignoscripta atroalba]|nr:hypothetical protein [Lignoscripta atroalba]